MIKQTEDVEMIKSQVFLPQPVCSFQSSKLEMKPCHRHAGKYRKCKYSQSSEISEDAKYLITYKILGVFSLKDIKFIRTMKLIFQKIHNREFAFI